MFLILAILPTLLPSVGLSPFPKLISETSSETSTFPLAKILLPAIRKVRPVMPPSIMGLVAGRFLIV